MDIRALLSFGAIYLVWGSTYMAIKYAVAEIPPLATAGVRHLVAGLLLYVVARRRSPAPTRREWSNSFLIGFLFFLVGHGTLHWAQRTVPSGVAALLIATEPIWIVVWMVLLLRETRLGVRGCADVLLGVAGVALVLPWESTYPASLVSGAAVLLGAAAWAAGVVLAQRLTLPSDSTMRTGSTLLAGSVLLLATAGATGELREISVPSARALAALAYLIVFGSIAAYSAYFWLLKRYPPVLVATHTYVNPLVAVLLGWLAGGEVIGLRLVLGLAVIVGAIALIGFRSKPKPSLDLVPRAGCLGQDLEEA
jgi:drug/metabolite transporter (DMT)-like permease